MSSCGNVQVFKLRDVRTSKDVPPANSADEHSNSRHTAAEVSERSIYFFLILTVFGSVNFPGPCGVLFACAIEPGWVWLRLGKAW